MAERLEVADGRHWVFSPDVLAIAGERSRAMLRARLVDEISGQPLRGPITVRCPRADLWPRVASDGLVGLVAQPSRVLPDLAASGTDLTLNITSEGFLPRQVGGTLGPIAGFAASFAALDLGDVPMHRSGVSLSGRVLYNLAPTPVPLAGATVRIDALWSHPPPAFWVAPGLSEPPQIVALTPGVYGRWAPGAAVRERALTLSAAVKTLMLPVSPGQTRLRLSDRSGLASGTPLALGLNDAAGAEVIVITAVEPTLAPDEPSWVSLAYPVARLHREGARCAAATPQPVVSLGAVAREAPALDPVLLLVAAPVMTDGAVVEIDDGVAAPEYQRVAHYATATNADGYFRLPPIARVAMVRLLVQHAGVADGHPVVSVDAPRATTPLVVVLE